VERGGGSAARRLWRGNSVCALENHARRQDGYLLKPAMPLGINRGIEGRRRDALVPQEIMKQAREIGNASDIGCRRDEMIAVTAALLVALPPLHSSGTEGVSGVGVVGPFYRAVLTEVVQPTTSVQPQQFIALNTNNETGSPGDKNLHSGISPPPAFAFAGRVIGSFSNTPHVHTVFPGGQSRSRYTDAAPPE